MATTVYSGWSKSWKPSGSSVNKKYRTKVVYSTSTTNTDYTISASVGVNLNSSVSASFEAELYCVEPYGAWSATGKGKTVFGESTTVTLIPTKSHAFKRKTSKYTVEILFETASGNGSWDWDTTNTGKYITFTVPALPSYTITFNASGGAGGPTSQTKYFGTALTLSASKPTKTGYTFTGWKSSVHGGIYQPGATYPKDFNSADTLVAQWDPNTYTITFNENGATSGTVPSSMNVRYSSSFIPPSSGNLERANYDFKTWNTKADGSGTDFDVGTSYTWHIASNTILYAKWQSKIASVNYLYSSNINVASENNYTSIDSRTTPWESEYEIINQVIPSPTDNYIFSGYYSVDSAYKYVHKEFGIEFPAGVIPYNYTKSDLVGSNIVAVGDEIDVGHIDINLYAIYRDNTNSLISIKNSSYEYIPPSVTENDYYLYLTGQTSSFNSSVSNANMVASIKFSINQIYDAISIDFDNIMASLTTENGSDIIELKSPIFHKSLYNPQTNTIDTYIIFRTSGEAGIGTLFDYDTTRYILSVSNINDSFGKSLLEAPMTIIISPPKILRDINSDGDVISLFVKAPDYEEKHTDDELLINGNILLGLFKYDETSTDLIDTQLYDIIVNDLSWDSDIVEIEV